MKLKSLFYLLLVIAVFTQGCKKGDSTDDTTTTTETPALQAYINGAVWTPDTLSASITYNAASQSKTFTITGTKSQKRIAFTVKLNNAGNDNSFTTGTYNVDATANVSMAYFTQQATPTGGYAFVQHGTVQPGSGSVIITSVNGASKTITGTFSFTSTNKRYDNEGNITAIDVAGITSGQFNNLPYTFTSN